MLAYSPIIMVETYIVLGEGGGGLLLFLAIIDVCIN
jgi:hypothetical protein